VWLSRAAAAGRDAVTPYASSLVDDVRRFCEERDRFRAALCKIAEINDGPDRASGEWRCGEAERIAKEALTGGAAS